MQNKKDWCKDCENNCCSNKFVGLSKSLKGKSESEFSQILLDEEDIERLKNFDGGGWTHLIECENGKFFIKLNPDNSCPAFKGGVCLIYKARPNVCRLYPYYFDPFCGMCIDKNCPYFNEIAEKDVNELYKIFKKRIDYFLKIEKQNNEKIVSKTKKSKTNAK